MSVTATVVAANLSTSMRRVDTLSTTKRAQGAKCKSDGAICNPFSKPFTVRACPSTAYDKPYTLQPLHLLYRAKLSLSFIDNASGSSTLPTSKLFSSRIDALEQQLVPGAHADQPQILIARLLSDKSLFAVERVKDGIYTLCKIGSWIRSKALAELATSTEYSSVAITSAVLEEKLGQEVQRPTSRNQDIPTVGYEPAPRRHCLSRTEEPRPSSKGLLHSRNPSRESVTQLSQAGAGAGAVQDHQTLQHVQPDSPSVSAELPEEITATPLSAQQVFENLVSQYLEALYLSKTSLAFFAKGPLSRARAAFNSSNDSLSVAELVTSLRSMIPDVKSLDKKHRERVPGIIKALLLSSFSDDEITAARKRKSKRVKLGKDGMFNVEEEHVRRWWMGEDHTSSPRSGDETPDGLLKRRIAELRVRETLAQIILILEVLALEALPAYQESKILKRNQETTTEVEAKGKLTKGKGPKTRKSQRLEVNLDLLLDKLCIWQSLEQDGVGALFQATPTKRGRDGCNSAEDGDRLRGFCIEVIVPFYLSRLPEQAAMINKKLGGPAPTSPTKRPTPKAKPATSSQKPGEPATREAPSTKPRKSLHRVSTDISEPTHKHPSLLRSATDSLVPHLKREISEDPLALIPHASAQPRCSRDSASQVKRFSRREVDLTTITATSQAKLKRKRAIEEELQGAIHTLKKPNRSMAVKELVDATEQRQWAAAGRAKKPAHAMRKAPNQSIQVTATPRHVRKPKDMALQPTPSRSLENAPLSSGICIPSSAVRAGALHDVEGTARTSRATLAPPVSHHHVLETPSRGSGKNVNDFLAGIGSGNAEMSKPISTFKIPGSAKGLMDKWMGEKKEGGKKEVHFANFAPVTGKGVLRPDHIHERESVRALDTIFITPAKKTAPVLDPMFSTPAKRLSFTPESSIAKAVEVCATPVRKTGGDSAAGVSGRNPHASGPERSIFDLWDEMDNVDDLL